MVSPPRLRGAAVKSGSSPSTASTASGVQKKKPCSGSASTCSACGACQNIFRVTSGDGRGAAVERLIGEELGEVAERNATAPARAARIPPGIFHCSRGPTPARSRSAAAAARRSLPAPRSGRRRFPLIRARPKSTAGPSAKKMSCSRTIAISAPASPSATAPPDGPRCRARAARPSRTARRRMPNTHGKTAARCTCRRGAACRAKPRGPN